MMKMCNYCHKMVKAGQKCSCIKPRKTESNRLYDKANRNDKYSKFYHSKGWVVARDKVKNYCNSLDIYAFLFEGRWQAGRVVHHIIPLKEGWNKRLAKSNLILLSDETHEKLHKRMEQSKEEKQKVINELKECLQIWATMQD